MKEIRYFYCPNAESENMLPPEEGEHAIKVVRLTENDEINIVDGKGNLYCARITKVKRNDCYFEILEKTVLPKTWNGELHLGIAPTKNMDRMEWLVEKATEIGFDGIHLLHCKFSERKEIKVTRLEKIAISAMKQSHKALLPQIEGMQDFKAFVSKPFNGDKFIAHCYKETDITKNGFKEFLFNQIKDSKEKHILVLIGPEGDFSIDEVIESHKHGFKSTSLGPSRLRTETAGLNAIFMMNLNNTLK